MVRFDLFCVQMMYRRLRTSPVLLRIQSRSFLVQLHAPPLFFKPGLNQLRLDHMEGLLQRVALKISTGKSTLPHLTYQMARHLPEY